MAEPLADRLARVRLLVLDVDGVLTDGAITYTDAGDEVKRFHVRDGAGLKVWRQAGHRAAVISGRTSKAVERRMRELQVSPVLLGRDDKAAALAELLAEVGATPAACCAVGDDLPDLPVLRACGVAVAVADACPEVRSAADRVTMLAGGQGAVREVVEWLLQAQGRWAGLTAAAGPPG
jgi:3-deoxy-D-manno-octulosonate 8-phosphate phosphatase (KDO 8-P phosphatase)